MEGLFRELTNVSSELIPDNSSGQMDFNYTRSKLYSWVITPPALVFFIACICANILIFVFVLVSRTYKRYTALRKTLSVSPANYLLANLCLSSTLFIANQIIYNFEKAYQLFSYGHWTCVVDSYFHRIPLPLMTLTIMSLSVDRCRIARDPLNMPSKSSATFQILLVWTVSLLVSIPRGLGSEFVPNTNQTFKCKMVPFLYNRVAQASFATLNVFIIYIVPALYLINELRRTRSQMQYLTACQIEQGKSFARRLRLMRNACIFTLIFITCWLPLGLMQFPLDFVQPERMGWMEPVRLARDVFGTAVLIQACVNPILLQLFSFDFQEVIAYCMY